MTMSLRVGRPVSVATAAVVVLVWLIALLSLGGWAYNRFT